MTNKLIITYDPYYEPTEDEDSWSDGNVESSARKWIKDAQSYLEEFPDGEYSGTVSSELAIDAFRYLVNLGEIDHKDIMFLFEKEQFHLDKDARWIGNCLPKNSVHEKFLMQLISPVVKS